MSLIIRCFSSMGKKSSERVLTIPVGNATNSTELSYEFEIKDSVKPRPQGLNTHFVEVQVGDLYINKLMKIW